MVTLYINLQVTYHMIQVTYHMIQVTYHMIQLGLNYTLTFAEYDSNDDQ